MAVNTAAFLEALRARINTILPTYYEEAPSRATQFPYAVITNPKITDLAQGDQMFFYIELWGDEKAADTTERLEAYCDELRNELTGAVLFEPGVFGAHLGFEAQNPIPDGEYDLTHRRLSMSARIFYN